MKKDITRRTALKWVAAGAVVGVAARTEHGFAAPGALSAKTDAWRRTHDRVWLGGEYWANPMEDWRIVDGAAECQSLGGNRSIHSLTHQITEPAKGFHNVGADRAGGGQGEGCGRGIPHRRAQRTQ